MTEAELQLPVQKIIKVAGVLGISLGVNYLINHLLKSPHKNGSHQKIQQKKQIQQKKLKVFKQFQSWNQKKFSKQQEFNQNWGTLKILNFDQEDGLLQQLNYQTKALCDLERVNNLIVDLQLSQVKTIPCPLIAHKKKKIQGEPFLQKEAIVTPGQFLIKNCVFKSGQSIENEKKFMRAGPRNTQFFDPKQVRADIVCLGKLCPGINTIIRELVFMLKNVYKVDKVFGVKSSFEGYYANNSDPSSKTIIQLEPEKLETIHHRGGCYLSMCKTQFKPKQIVDNLVKRGINQVYLVGAFNTFLSTYEIYQEIKHRKLAIGICVLLKSINKDVAIFDTCFGFQSAVQQCQRYIEEAYVSAKSYKNTVSLIKVPGKYSGFLAADATRAARNANICLVPQFPFDLYGKSGVLRYISQRIKFKGSCIIIYSQGSCHAARDIDLSDKQNWQDAINHFDKIFKDSIAKELTEAGLIPNNVMFFESTQQVRSIPANSLDTKLCCQIAHSSIYGLMAGYTNFVCGHLGYRNAMVPMTEMMTRQNLYCLKPEDEAWQRTLATTGQPSFINL